ncbi:hypothetical protein BFJ66_g17738 [Fusarium oxysporum f. sp. cepae]|uniref:Secreted in xylem 7 n=1 Tax=Fusarium oxysporum f. sp. cepae TaxID=396571 RepID=A0A3L6MZK3_FUSOX|nr:hypothetical protein BFJ65_g14509 [Fusarium oxysporum f. sp. cepae]RKK21068.1 hypothetical protein BFJ66_g17738 [Fusarium oxysporum f. sp. cepae]
MYLRVLSIFFCLYALAQCATVEPLFRRQGQCFSLVVPRPAPAQALPPRDIDITANIFGPRAPVDLPWTPGDRTPGHVWQWRAWRSRDGTRAFLETQFYGYQGAHVELRVRAPREGDRPAIEVEPNVNVNGGGAAGWGEIRCITFQYPGPLTGRSFQFIM